MPRSLSPQEIQHRLTRLRNLEKLHTGAKYRITVLEQENKDLREKVATLETRLETSDRTIQTLALQVEELRTMVFGKKQEKKRDDDLSPPKERVERTKESYHRPLPSDNEVTGTEDHPLSECATCHTTLIRTETKTCFVEDIPLPQKKTVVKHTVARGYCLSCKKWRSATPLPTTPVVLGPNVRRYVAYLSVVARQSYSQIQDLLLHTYQFALSEGEISKILRIEGNRLHPELERLTERIRGEPSVHLDETTWNLLQSDGYRRYGWTMVGGASGEAVYLLGKTRGKGNAEKLLGESTAVVVSDDYAVYRNLKNPHQLCLAHILRKLRDLAESLELSETLRSHCAGAYQTFASIYAAIEEARISDDPTSSHHILLKRLRTFSNVHTDDPKKLANIRTQVRERTENYLTCLMHPGVAADNNPAERALRHLILKRKVSFGSLQERGAETLSVLVSVLLSFRKRGELGEYVRGV